VTRPPAALDSGDPNGNAVRWSVLASCRVPEDTRQADAGSDGREYQVLARASHHHAPAALAHRGVQRVGLEDPGCDREPVRLSGHAPQVR
jgi:hypothetical protein